MYKYRHFEKGEVQEKLLKLEPSITWKSKTRKPLNKI